MPVGKRVLITMPPGVNKDDTSYSSTLYSNADKIRFYRDQPQKIGGWLQLNIDNLVGVTRSMFSWRDATNVENTMIGTNARLYVFKQGVLTNITPLVTGTTAIANSLSTNFFAVGSNNPLSTTIGSPVITLNYNIFATDVTFKIGDLIFINGLLADIGGVPFADINGAHPIISKGAGTISFLNTSQTLASSSTSGGLLAITISTHVISVAQVAHGFENGDRIKILAAAGFNNYVAGDLNQESIVRNKSANAYDYYSSTADISGHFPSAAVTGQGGAGTTVQGQIAGGVCDFIPAEGYGGGLYGSGLYGEGSAFGTGYTLPRIWSFDRFGVSCVMTPGNGGGLYIWNGVITAAPILLSGAPSAINYVFVAGRQIVTLGAAGVPNRIQTNESSSTGTPGQWTPAAGIDIYVQDVPNTGRLIAHGYSRGKFLLFAEDSVKAMNYLGSGNTIWNLSDIMSSDGLIGPKAVLSINDAVVWVGQNNFYKYDGSVVSILPNNTLRQWFFDNLNQQAYYKCFIHKSIEFNEIWFYFPFLGSKEPNTYVIWNFEEGHYTNGLMTRTASEIPVDVSREQYLASGSCDGSIVSTLYQHEIEGNYSDNGGNMTGSLSTNQALLDGGDYLQYVDRIIPSSQLLPLGNINQSNNIYQLTVNTKEYDGQITSRVFGPFQVDTSTQKIEARATGRQWEYVFNFSNQVGFRIEKYYAEIKPTTPR